MNVSIEEGKYEYRFYPDGESEVLRYGEPWIDTCGDKFIYGMAAEIHTLRKQLDELLAAATAVVERWDSPLWKDLPHTGEYINALRAAIASVKEI